MSQKLVIWSRHRHINMASGTRAASWTKGLPIVVKAHGILCLLYFMFFGEQLARELSRVWTDTQQPRTRSARDTIASAEPVVQQQEYGQQQRVETPSQSHPDSTDHPPVNSQPSVPTSQRRPGNKKGSNGKGSTIVSVGTIAGVRTPKTLLPSHLEVHA